jgi:hypothetical protein
MYYCLHSLTQDTFARGFSAYTDVCADGDNHGRGQRLLFPHVLPQKLLVYAAASQGQSDQGVGLSKGQHAEDHRQLGASTS